jgi:hypothetical protein
VQSVSGANVQQGTLSLASESWGVGPGATAIATGNYAVELYWRVPVAENEKDLSGAVFCQTSATDLTLQLEFAQLATLFTVTGNDTVALTGTVIIEAEKYSIPAENGVMIVPDLSLFHSLVQTNIANAVQTGDNEPRLIGQGAGRTLLRLFFQTWNGAVPQTPLAATATNYGPQGWRYGTNETPELFPDGRSLRQWNEQLYGSDTAAVWGFLCHEFEATWAFRDSVDQGATSDLRLYINIAAALTNPTLEYVQETMFAAGSAAYARGPDRVRTHVQRWLRQVRHARLGPAQPRPDRCEQCRRDHHRFARDRHQPGEPVRVAGRHRRAHPRPGGVLHTRTGRQRPRRPRRGNTLGAAS